MPYSNFKVVRQEAHGFDSKETGRLLRLDITPANVQTDANTGKTYFAYEEASFAGSDVTRATHVLIRVLDENRYEVFALDQGGQLHFKDHPFGRPGYQTYGAAVDAAPATAWDGTDWPDSWPTRINWEEVDTEGAGSPALAVSAGGQRVFTVIDRDTLLVHGVPAE